MWGIVLGIVSLIINVLGMQHPQVSNINWLLDVALLALAYMVGRDASKQGRRPAWNGALIGAIYGILVGLAGFFQHITIAQLTSEVKPGVSTAMIKQFVTMENSPITHLSSMAIGAVFFGLLGLIAGSLGARREKRVAQQNGSKE